MTDAIKTMVDAASAELLRERSLRGHLGASAIGQPCKRAVWYAFRRHHYIEKHTGRIYRLFDRGHTEEARIAKWLRAADFTVWDYAERLILLAGRYKAISWDADIGQGEDVSDNAHHIALAKAQGVELKQWQFETLDGHYSGSCDGKIMFPSAMQETYPGRGLLECKTHSTKSFVLLKEKGVLSSKPAHYVQAQVYMYEMHLPWALYVAVNKNDDDLYFEVLHAKPELGEQYRDLAEKIIKADHPPARLSNDPSWYECKFCDFREICHYQKKPMVNCRSCAMASPAPNKQWRCAKFNSTIPEEFMAAGCGEWTQID